jgi:hypothetical protein
MNVVGRGIAASRRCGPLAEVCEVASSTSSSNRQPATTTSTGAARPRVATAGRRRGRSGARPSGGRGGVGRRSRRPRGRRWPVRDPEGSTRPPVDRVGPAAPPQGSGAAGGRGGRVGRVHPARPAAAAPRPPPWTWPLARRAIPARRAQSIDSSRREPWCWPRTGGTAGRLDAGDLGLVEARRSGRWRRPVPAWTMILATRLS